MRNRQAMLSTLLVACLLVISFAAQAESPAPLRSISTPKGNASVVALGEQARPMLEGAPTATPMPITQCYCASEEDRIYRVDASAFYGYTSDSANASRLVRISSPPAPQGWTWPDFSLTPLWRTATDVWWDLWAMSGWSHMPAGCRPIGLLDSVGAPEGADGTTHLIRRTFALYPPQSGWQVLRASLEMWSDNKAEWWWNGVAVMSDREGYGGMIELFPSHISPIGGIYSLAVQTSNDRMHIVNPQGTSYRLCVTWAPAGVLIPRYVNIPLLLRQPTPTPTPRPTATPTPGCGTLTGHVVSATTGQAIAGASVCVLTTGQCATTEGNGQYTIPCVPPTGHAVRASADGYISLDQVTAIAAGQTSVLNFALSPVLAHGEMRIVLTWGQNPSDLDSHLWLPVAQPFHVYWYNPGACDVPPYACLDVDDTTSYGPETLTLRQRYAGLYIYAVLWYEGMGTWPTSGARVQVYDQAGLMAEFSAPSAGAGEWWYVLDLDGATGNITPRNYLTPFYPGPY